MFLEKSIVEFYAARDKGPQVISGKRYAGIIYKAIC